MGQLTEDEISRAPESVRMGWARRDAVAAIGRCMLPLAPQSPPRDDSWWPSGLIEGFVRWRHNQNEPTSYQCAVREMRSKPDRYHVRAFTRMEEDDLMQQGMRRAEQAPPGSTRPRRYRD